MRETQAAPLVLELLGRGCIDVEMHSAQFVGPERPCVLHCSRSRHVELADEDQHNVSL